MKSVLIVLSLVSLSAFASESLDAAAVTWTEINGAEWSSVLPKKYRNTDIDGTRPVNNTIQKSDATEACRAIGGELPTKQDYQAIDGEIDMGNGWYWTSSVADLNNPDPLNPTTGLYRQAYNMVGANHELGDPHYVQLDDRNMRNSVRCIRSSP